MRISDWSSDVCSSDLRRAVRAGRRRAQPLGLGKSTRARGARARAGAGQRRRAVRRRRRRHVPGATAGRGGAPATHNAAGSETREIGRAAGRERGWQSVENSVVGVSLKKKKKKNQN